MFCEHLKKARLNHHVQRLGVLNAFLFRTISIYRWVYQEVKPLKGFPGDSVVQNPCAIAGDAGDKGSIPESGRSPGEGNGNPLQYSCLENPMYRGPWWAAVHGFTESDTTDQLSTRAHTHTHTHTYTLKAIES